MSLHKTRIAPKSQDQQAPRHLSLLLELFLVLILKLRAYHHFSFLTATAYLFLSLVDSLQLSLPKLPPRFHGKYDSHKYSKLPQMSAIPIPIPFWTNDDFFPIHIKTNYLIDMKYRCMNFSRIMVIENTDQAI